MSDMNLVTLSEDPQSQNGECVDVVKISVLFTQMKEKEFYGNIYKAGLCDPPTQWN